MKKFILIIPFSVLTACDPAPNSTVSQTTEISPQVVAPSAEFYANRPAQYNWPTASEIPQKDPALLLTKNYYLVIDGSGSMNDSGCSGSLRKIDAAKAAVDTFIDAIPAESNVGLLVFDVRGIGERVALSGNHAEVKQQVHRIVASGGTPLLSAMTAAYDAITLQGQKQFGYGEYHMVVVTDGEANINEDPASIVTKILQESPLTIHTIGFCIGEGHSLNLPGITNYRAANNPDELLAGLQNVLAEATEYTPTTFNEAKVH